MSSEYSRGCCDSANTATWQPAAGVRGQVAWVQIRQPTTWPRASPFPSLSRGYLICKMGVTTTPSFGRMS